MLAFLKRMGGEQGPVSCGPVYLEWVVRMHFIRKELRRKYEAAFGSHITDASSVSVGTLKSVCKHPLPRRQVPFSPGFGGQQHLLL